MATASLSFKYDPLPTCTSIRLLQNVLNLEGKMRFRLLTEDLEDNPAFKALSYTWGVPNTILIEDIDQTPKTTKVNQDLQDVADEEANDEAEAFKIFRTETWRPYESMIENTPKAHSIVCNGCHIPITENLYEGFTQVLKLDSSKDGVKYWVDAICINQQDFQERAAQVAIMGRIYQSADTVIGWLGPSLGYDEFGGSLLRKIFEEIIDPESSETALENGELGSLERADVLQKFGIFSLLQRLWFRRIWIVQGEFSRAC
jgi:Heterokaryon incompatibility protein (HET)